MRDVYTGADFVVLGATVFFVTQLYHTELVKDLWKIHIQVKALCASN